MSNRIQRRRLAKYKRRKDTSRTSEQFLRWSLRYHALSNRIDDPRKRLWYPIGTAKKR